MTSPSGGEPDRRVLSTAHGTTREAFGPLDWSLLGGAALIWGASFLLIAVGLRAFTPGVVALLRIAFGGAALALVPAARRPVDRADWGRIAVLGLTWMAAPFLLIPVAQQWIDSSLAGMLNAAMPLFAAVIAAVLLRSVPGRRHVLGLVIGFAGVVAVSWPAIRGARVTALGTVLVLVASLAYAFSVNVAVPLQQRYGSLPVLLRVQAVALVVVGPVGLVGWTGSHVEAASLAAVAMLGVLGTGLAYVAMASLVGRVGAGRGSVTIYFVPIVAIVLGVVFLDETVEAIALAGTALILAGAALASRREV